MENYMDGAFVVTNHTIITYNGTHHALKIPGRFGDIEVTKIGSGAFMESILLQCAIVPPQVKKIGESAFFNCPALTSVFLPGNISRVDACAFSNCKVLNDITIYDLALTPDEYHTFKSTGIKTQEGTYVLREMPQNELVQKILSGIDRIIKPAIRIPDHISSLFHLVTLDEEKGKFSLRKNVPVMGFSVPSVPVVEHEAFCGYIKNRGPEVHHIKTEQKNDWYVRVGKEPHKDKTVIFTFDDTKTKEKNGMVYIHATLKIGHFFWQSAQPVIYGHKRYYVYRRCYLSSDPEMEYIRRDIAVYTDQGLVNDREEAQKVYAKYKLMSIL